MLLPAYISITVQLYYKHMFTSRRHPTGCCHNLRRRWRNNNRSSECCKNCVTLESILWAQGSNGPHMCITDDSTAERSAIHNVWPDTLLHFPFFTKLVDLAMEWWSWHTEDDRPVLMQLVKKLVFTKSEESLKNRYYSLINSELCFWVPTICQIPRRILGKKTRMGLILQSYKNFQE